MKKKQTIDIKKFECIVEAVKKQSRNSSNQELRIVILEENLKHMRRHIEELKNEIKDMKKNVEELKIHIEELKEEIIHERNTNSAGNY